jgi:excisionase family DNA binding protein
VTEIANERLLTPSEVGAKLRVAPRTVSRWARKGRLEAIRTPGGHRRFRETDIDALLRGSATPALVRSGPPSALMTPTTALDQPTDSPDGDPEWQP